MRKKIAQAIFQALQASIKDYMKERLETRRLAITVGNSPKKKVLFPHQKKESKSRSDKNHLKSRVLNHRLNRQAEMD